MLMVGIIVLYFMFLLNGNGKCESSWSKFFWISMYIVGLLRILMVSINCLYEYIKKFIFGFYKWDNK